MLKRHLRPRESNRAPEPAVSSRVSVLVTFLEVLLEVPVALTSLLSVSDATRRGLQPLSALRLGRRSRACSGFNSLLVNYERHVLCTVPKRRFLGTYDLHIKRLSGQSNWRQHTITIQFLHMKFFRITLASYILPVSALLQRTLNVRFPAI
jgi:hypothetical protein